MKMFLKILKYVLYVIGFISIGLFVYFFIMGIYNACVADDIITAQNRIGGAYSFLWMVGFGLLSIAALFPTLAIKEEIYLDNFIDNVRKLLKK